MSSTLVTCGFCTEEFINAHEYAGHYCDKREYWDERINVPTGSYLPRYDAEVEAFLAKYPEFRNQDGLYLSELPEAPADYDFWGLPVADANDSPTVTEITREDEWSGIYDLRDNYQTMTEPRYKDLDPTTCTHAINWWWSHKDNIKHDPDHVRYGNKHMPSKGNWSELTSYEQRQALDFNDPNLRVRFEFADLQGFVAQQIIDMDITAKFHAQVFNGYNGRDGKFHIGLLTFNYVDGRPVVTCGNKTCHYHTTAFDYRGDFSWESMVEFTLACIRHGNNHGPAWLTRRNDFTYIHAENCDTNHSWTAGCNALNPKAIVQFTTDTPEEALAFLIQHRKFCRQTTCRCTHYYHLLSAVERNDYNVQYAA